MWHEIHKVINRTPPRRRRGTSAIDRVIGEPVAEQIIKGVALSPTDILSEAVHALLDTDAASVETTWEAYAVGIAKNKAKGALRTSQAWLHGTEHRAELRLVSGDEPASVTNSGDAGPSIFDTLESDDPHPGVRELLRQNAPGEPHAHEDDIDFGKNGH